jgi:hypothetical protein
MAKAPALHPNVTPRGLSREEAAEYWGIGVTLFDQHAPPPKRIGTRNVWDIRALDKAFDRLPEKVDAEPGRGGWEGAIP